MRDWEYKALRAVEDEHWWHAVLRRMVLEVLNRELKPQSRLLDAGCGTGGMLAFLAQAARGHSLEGIDASAEAIRQCRHRGIPGVSLANVEDLPFRDESFDAVLSLDVLYHAGVNEASALAEMTRVLRPRGLLLVNVAAFQCLRGAHDESVCGARRYTQRQLRDQLTAHNLAVEQIHYWNAWLFAPLWIWRSWTRWFPGGVRGGTSELQRSGGWVNRILKLPACWDARLCQALKVPFGSSVLAVARKA